MSAAKSKLNVLITGANGFVGCALVNQLNANSNFKPRAALRRVTSKIANNVEQILVAGLAEGADWSAALKNVDVIVHAAARVHVMDDSAVEPLAEFRRVNVAGTLSLARQAVLADVKRFIFISSIKVNGEVTFPAKPFKADDEPAPVDPYGVSKLEAEKRLYELAADTDMEIVIIRPVLVYGPGVKANFLRMMSWLDKGIPLPFGLICNKRSLVALDNLVDLIITCVDHPGADNQIFLVSDGEDLSTTDILRRMGDALGRRARLISIPDWLLKSVAVVLGKSDISQRLFSSLQVDTDKTYSILGWVPPVSVDDAFGKMVKQFLEKQDL